jgi:hypothetical protein
MKDPARLLDDPLGVPEELRRGLDRLSATRPSPEQLCALATRMGLASLPPPPPAAATGLKSGAVLKLIAAIGVGGAVAGGYLLTRSDVPQARQVDSTALAAAPAVPAASDSALDRALTTPPRAHHADTPAVTTETERAQQEPESLEQSPPRSAPPSTELGRPAARAGEAQSGINAQAPRAHRAEPRPSSDVDGETVEPAPPITHALSETELLGDARAALDRSPAVALTFCERHRREFPNGALVQEREIIAVTALVRLGRTSDARARAERFRRSYPRSAYLRQLERVLSVAK